MPKDQPVLIYKPETKVELYYFQKLKACMAENSLLRQQKGQDDSYIQELTDTIKVKEAKIQEIYSETIMRQKIQASSISKNTKHELNCLKQQLESLMKKVKMIQVKIEAIEEMSKD